MKIFRRIRLYLVAGFLGGSIFLHAQEFTRQPSLPIEQAIELAKSYVVQQKIDISKHHIDSARLQSNPRGDRGPYWLITWELNAYADSGQVFLNVYMNKQIEVTHGEVIP